MALLAVVITRAGSKSVDYGVFWNLLNDEREAKKIDKVVFRDPDRMEVTLKADALKEDSANVLSAKFREKIRNLRFEVKVPGEDKELLPKLRELAAQDKMQLLREDEPFAGLGSLIFFLLPMILLMAFFFFVLPRMRDPMGGRFFEQLHTQPCQEV